MTKGNLEDALVLLNKLVLHEVRFLVIGGQAVISYTNHRETSDLDLLIDRTVENISRLNTVIPLDSIQHSNGFTLTEEFMKAGRLIKYPGIMGRPHVADLLSSIDSIDFDDTYSRAQKYNFYGLDLKVPCIEDLIAMKKVSTEANSEANKPRDLADIAALEGLL